MSFPMLEGQGRAEIDPFHPLKLYEYSTRTRARGKGSRTASQLLVNSRIERLP